MSDLPYDVFISYRRSDGSNAAHWIRRELEAFRAPRSLRPQFSRKLRVYLDVAYERGTIDFYRSNIQPALMGSRHLVVIATPDAALREDPERDWIRREVDEFSSGENGSNLLMVRGRGPFDGPLPAGLSNRFENIEIIDLRDVSRLWFLNPLRASRISNEKIKLIAPIIGVDANLMPVLRREEERRQQSRIAMVLGAVLAVFMAISALTVFALHSRARATSALESGLATTGSLILSLNNLPSTGGQMRDQVSGLISDACDVFDKLRVEANADPRARPMVICYSRRAGDYEKLKELTQARKLLDAAIVQATEFHRRSHRADDARSVAVALSQLQGFLGRNGTKEERMTQLQRSNVVLDELIDEHSDETSLVLDRLSAIGKTAFETDIADGSADMIAELDKGAKLAAEHSAAAFRDRADILVWRAKLLIVAELFSKGATSIPDRLAAADETIDSALAADVDPKPKVSSKLDAIQAYELLARAYAIASRPEDVLRVREKGMQQLGLLKDAGLNRQEKQRLDALGKELAGENPMR